jgi:hypothetical protein
VHTEWGKEKKRRERGERERERVIPFKMGGTGTISK